MNLFEINEELKKELALVMSAKNELEKKLSDDLVNLFDIENEAFLYISALGYNNEYVVRNQIESYLRRFDFHPLLLESFQKRFSLKALAKRVNLKLVKESLGRKLFLRSFKKVELEKTAILICNSMRSSSSSLIHISAQKKDGSMVYFIFRLSGSMVYFFDNNKMREREYLPLTELKDFSIERVVEEISRHLND